VADQSIAIRTPWKPVKEALELQGLALDKDRSIFAGRIYSYLIKKDIFVASKIRWNLRLDISVIEPGRARRAGLMAGLMIDGDEKQVEQGRVNLSAEINMAYEEVAKQRGQPQGSILEFILNSEELKRQGAIWPVMKRINVRYTPVVFYANSRSSHAGFEAEVEFIASEEKEVGGMTFALDIESQLDPPFPAVDDFKPADKYGRVIANVRTEWWAGHTKAEKEANKISSIGWESVARP
jgi:hypothetical protein